MQAARFRTRGGDLVTTGIAHAPEAVFVMCVY
jgi:hypothetical protein